MRTLRAAGGRATPRLALVATPWLAFALARWLALPLAVAPWLLRASALLVALAATTPSRAQDVLPVPPLTGRQVIDQTATLTAEQDRALNDRLAALERDTGSQVVVLIVPSTRPEDIAAYAQRVADTWKIGRRDVGDGVVLVVAKNDRRVRIEVAKTLEGAIPDLAARRIIDEAITPAFRAGDFSGGLSAAVDRIAQRIRGENLPAPGAQPRGEPEPGVQWPELMMFFFVGVPVVGAVLTGMLGRKLGSLATGAAAGGLAWWISASLLLAGAAGIVALVLVGVMGVGAARGRAGGLGRRGGPPIIWGGPGWGGGGGGSWGGGGGGGGGFSSGGGGDFGGGGASGGW